MNVVIVGGFLPYPANSGSRIRMLNLAVRLARRHKITYFAARNPDRTEGRQALEYLGDHGIEAVEVDHTPLAKRGLRFYAKLAGNLVSHVPYSVASFDSPALRRAVVETASRRKVDLWQADWLSGMAAFAAIPGARTIGMTQNVETQVWERYASAEMHPLKRAYITAQARKFARYEGRMLAAAGRVVTVSLEDAALVQERFGVPADRIDVVDNGIDRPYFESVRPSADYDPRRILFLGSLDWRPNLDALGVLLDRVFPAVRAAVPDATLEVVGRNPPAALGKRLAATPGATLHGNVADVRPFLARAGVMAVPLRVGGGSRLKILEALASGVPVVSTRVGAEGLELTPGEDLVVVDGEEAFIPALVDALRNPTRMKALAARGRALVMRRYDWDSLADALERSWERCAGAAPAFAGNAPGWKSIL